MKPVKSMSELWQLAKADENYQRLCIVALNNLGCDHLAESSRRWHPVKWEAYFNGLNQYIESLVCEYSQSEDKAVKDVLAEINGVRDCIDQAKLDWEG
jgi:hypothetical protein